jgi:hypothetical protein
MLAYAAIPLTCWLAALLAAPRTPRIGNEVEELVYARLLGRQERLRLLAIVATGAAFLWFALALPGHAADPDGPAAVRQVCTERPGTAPTCYTRQPGGGWRVERWQADGTVTQEGVLGRPPLAEDLARGSGG